MGKALTWISRILVGGLFIFSGIIKANDPDGFAFKLEEYFTVFGTEFLNPYAIYLSIFICVLEIYLGIALLLGIMRNFVVWMLLLMIAFFTFLTFYSAYFNKVTDCGCFGDFMKLTPWQSFWKDIILLIFIVILFVNRKYIYPFIKTATAGRIAFTGLVLSIIFPVYTYLYLPVWDFRPYNVGADIYEKMQIPEGASTGKYETVFIYKNKETGETREFAIAELPSDETVWVFEDRNTIELEAPYEPPIHDFAIFGPSGDDLTAEFLSQGGYRLLVVQYELKKSDIDAQKELNELAKKSASDNNLNFWALTSSPGDVTATYKRIHEVPYPIYQSDATTLKTIIRANPGLLLLKNNIILSKWSDNNLPSWNDLQEIIHDNE